ncbi:MAG: hypothetical protein EB127_16385 [Alphaproteobacteria bacterium]|nr:hypothetical protein [Alphaproteobacteria bacterium]
MTFKDYYDKKQIGPRHLKNDGLLNTRVPHKPVPDYYKVKKADGTETLKNNPTKKNHNISILQGKELLKKFNILNLQPNETKKLGNTGISIAFNPAGGYIISND